MGGVVKDIGQFFSSDVGRVLGGVVTGGMSEVGRASAGTARRAGVAPDITAGLGAATGGTLGGAISAPASLATDSKLAEGRLTEQQRALEASDAARTQREADLNARTETPQEALDAKRRAAQTAQRLGGGKRRASQVLMSPSLGGY